MVVTQNGEKNFKKKFTKMSQKKKIFSLKYLFLKKNFTNKNLFILQIFDF